MADRHPIDRALDCLADYERAIKGDNYNVNPDYPADVRDELAQWWAYNGDLEAEYRDLLKIVKEIDNRRIRVEER